MNITASPDVADDKNTIAAKRAKFQVRRTPKSANPLQVRVQLINSGIMRPTDNADLSAKYGTTLGPTSPYNDYYLTGVGWPSGTVALNTPVSVSIPEDKEFNELTVVPLIDNLTEANVIRLQVLPDNSGNDYSVGLQATADVTIYDGPEWTITELTGTYALGSSASAVNAGVLYLNGTWNVPPQVAGTAGWVSGGYSQVHGVLWTWPNNSWTTDFGTSFVPYGISFRPTTSSADRARVVGTYGAMAWRVLDNNTSGVQLPHLPGASPSVPWGISPNRTWIVGHSVLSSVKKPVKWDGVTDPPPPAENLAIDLLSGATGEAKAVNNAGVIVGETSGFTGGATLKRPFRNTGGGAKLTDNDKLTVPTGNWPAATGEGIANAVTLVPNPARSFAAGRFAGDSDSPKIAAYWAADASGLPAAPTDLGVLYRGGIPDAQSEALGINSALRIVGWSGTSVTDATRKAVIFRENDVRDLNDKFFIHGWSGWFLQSAQAISDNGAIVGNGTLNGSARGFLLVPRVTTTQP
ncbi:MAG TPA: hypothetical protein PLX89_00035 [Verrucomicrobiota bacterium]|nr:hypothetical protein [Verrucomicrobiales bacterium]HRI11365.1 hypothetical protein [Verrucomicrobiota bacterium]